MRLAKVAAVAEGEWYTNKVCYCKCNLARENWQHLFGQSPALCVLRARRGYSVVAAGLNVGEGEEICGGS